MTAGYGVQDLLWEQKRRLYRGGAGGNWFDIDPELQLAGFLAFCRDHVTIAHPMGKRPFVLRPEQEEVARSYIEQGKTLSLKARQIGFTTVTMAFCLWRMLFFDDFSVIMLSRKEEDAKAALAMVIIAYEGLSQEAKERFPFRLDRGVSKFTLSNGSWMESHPSANNPSRGRSASLMILDEWAFMPNPDDAWAATEPVTDIGGRIIALSTANGWGNMFHTTWVKANTGDNDFHPLFFPWWSVPERLNGWVEGEPYETAPWYLSKQRAMLPWQLAQEYPSNPEEAFIKSGNPVYDIELLRGLPTEDPMQCQLVGAHWRDRELVVTEVGPLSVYESPQSGAAYVVGVDVAQGLEHGDYSSAHVINAATGVVAAHWHGHLDPDLYGVEMAALGWWYNCALLGIEVNNHGLTTAKTVQREGYPNIYFRRRLGSRRETLSEELGWLTTRSSKPLIIDGLAQALRSDMTLLDAPTVTELMQYVRKADGGTEGSPHDDRVMSLAIANQMRRHVHETKVHKPFVIPKNSFAYELELMRREEREFELSQQALGRYGVRTRR